MPFFWGGGMTCTMVAYVLFKRHFPLCIRHSPLCNCAQCFVGMGDDAEDLLAFLPDECEGRSKHLMGEADCRPPDDIKITALCLEQKKPLNLCV